MKNSDQDQQKDPLSRAMALPSELFGDEGVFASFFRSFDPATMIQQNIQLTQNLFDIMMGKSKISPDARDWRFQDDTWRKNPFYQRLAQAYLAMTEAVEGMIPEGLADDERARAELAAEIVTSAFSPTNTLAGNPAAMLKAIETRGDSVAKGFRNFVDDWLNNDGMPSQVDSSGFQVGKNMAITPGQVVLKTEMFELIHYKPVGEKVHEIPTLLIPPQINRFYFTDLAPGRSFAEYVVGQGLNHFVVSWRNPQVEHAGWGLDDYVEATIEAIDAVAEIAGVEKINLIAFCAGGITSALASSYLKATGRDRINTLALCVTMLDWKVDATIGAFRLPTMLSVARAQSEMKGVLPGSDLGKVFTWLRPNDLVWNYWVNNYLMGETPAAFDILAWNNDSSNLPSKLHGDFMHIFNTNELVEPGKIEVLGVPIDLGQLTCDNYIVGAVTDHLTPWKACYRNCGLLGGKSTFALSNGGHVAALVNPPGNPKAYHFVAPAEAADAEAWEAGAVKRQGSWWEGWTAWVAERSGKKVPAPAKLGSKAHPAGTKAPGEYVLL